MRVIIIDWNSYGNESMKALMHRKGYHVATSAYNEHLSREEREAQVKRLSRILEEDGADYVFSYNYFPPVSEACQEKGVPYLAWVYDSPYMNIYSHTVLNPVNRIFVFDYGVYEEFEQNGIQTIHYLPLGADAAHFEKKASLPAPDCDICFVGSLYSESKHRIYDRFKDIDPYTHGYLDGIMEAQKHIYGVNFLEGLITPEAEAQMQKAYPCNPNADTVMTPARIYSQFVLSRQVTAMERREILTMLGERFADRRLHLHTNDAALRIPGIQNKGPVDYYDGMPAVFSHARINLNITLRSILTGIPLRALDILGSGGFLLSNYQAELEEYFRPGEDFVFYEDYEDLMNKAEYYLSHEKERAEIAENGCRKVRTEHSLEGRLTEMEKYLS
ncbi:MAG: DUF3880 domain-containing protein [Lachnospiraceae bacterium]|nr:DUF3880 domain-containing protein [Lachnospiraceae bacterium]